MISIANKKGHIITRFKETKTIFFCMSIKLGISNSEIFFESNLYKPKKTQRYHYIILKTILNQYKQFAPQAMNLNLENYNRCQQNNKQHVCIF